MNAFANANFLGASKILVYQCDRCYIKFFAWLNQASLRLSIFLHTVIIVSMFWIYKQEKNYLEKEGEESL